MTTRPATVHTELPVTRAPSRSRNRYFDFLRAAALLRVLVFHLFGWFWLPLLFPSLGVMFALAGSLMAASLDRAHSPWIVLRRRIRRLVPPLWAFGALVVPVMFAMGWTSTIGGTESPGLSLISWIIPITEPPASDAGYEWTLPLWYLRTYLWLVLLSPPLLWLWRHWPKALMVLPLLLLGLVTAGLITADGRFGSGFVSLLTFATCWMLGFAHHDGLLDHVRMRTILLAGVVLCAAGVGWALRYPLPGADGIAISDIPIATALFNLGFAAVLMRLPISLSWMERVPLARNILDAVNRRAITIYIWGNLAIFLGLELMDRTGAWEWVDRAWWSPTMLAATLLFLAGAVLTLGWVEDLAARRRPALIPIDPPKRRPTTPAELAPEALPVAMVASVQPDDDAEGEGPRLVSMEEVPTPAARNVRTRAGEARRKRVVRRRIVVATASLITLVVGGLAVLGSIGNRASELVRCVAPTALMGDLHSSPAMRDVAQMLVGSAENSSLYWEDQVGFLQYNVEGSEEWNRGYTGGIIGFTSATSSMLEVARRYDALQPENPLSPFLHALEAVNGTSSMDGLGPEFEAAWGEAAEDPAFLRAQLGVARDWYLQPALDAAKEDNLRALGQFAYYDAMIQHGASGFQSIRDEALATAQPPAEGGDEVAWMQSWIDAREAYMLQEVSESTATRVTTAQQGLLDSGQLGLHAPFEWTIYGDHFELQVAPFCSWR